MSLQQVNFQAVLFCLYQRNHHPVLQVIDYDQTGYRNDRQGYSGAG